MNYNKDAKKSYPAATAKKAPVMIDDDDDDFDEKDEDEDEDEDGMEVEADFA